MSQWWVANENVHAQLFGNSLDLRAYVSATYNADGRLLEVKTFLLL